MTEPCICHLLCHEPRSLYQSGRREAANKRKLDEKLINFQEDDVGFPYSTEPCFASRESA